MALYFAPLEGVTNAVFRRVHRERFSGVDKYFMPFVSPASHLTFTSGVQYELDPGNNAGIKAVPQLLTKDAELFNSMSALLADAGYGEVNLNLGCPSGTVIAKNKGAGLLRDIALLECFLDGIFAHPALPISIKTRLGFKSVDEWPELAELYFRYPLSELIVHPRTREELYSGRPHWDECLAHLKNAPFPVVCNGNLFTGADCLNLKRVYPGQSALMLGRGLVANPALAREVKGGEALTMAELRDFHDSLYDAYMRRWPENAVLGRMHEFMNYIVGCFENPQKPFKAIRKSKTVGDYSLVAKILFEECPLRENPGYLTDM